MVRYTSFVFYSNFISAWILTMSSKEITEIFTSLLKEDWEQEQIILFNRLMEGFLYSKRFMTKTMKQDFLEFLIIFQKLKRDLNGKIDSI